MAKTPVYRIKDFEEKQGSVFYVNTLHKHVREHAFTNLPHKHDFYLAMIVTKGKGIHEIDFKRYNVRSGSVFFMQPGQMHYWDLSNDIEGYVFFHSKDLYGDDLNELPFFRSYKSNPTAQLTKRSLSKLETVMKELIVENNSNQRYKIQRIHAFVQLIYTAIAREYPETKELKNRKYLEKFQKFEALIETYYKEQKLPGFYANELHITEKHLNRIARECVNKTSTELIAERVVLEAKRLLMNTELNVSQAGDELGFNDRSYFVRFFKKHVGVTPLSFLKRYT